MHDEEGKSRMRRRKGVKRRRRKSRMRRRKGGGVKRRRRKMRKRRVPYSANDAAGGQD